jgi:hypothetical protein
VASRTIVTTSATARIASSTHTHVGVSLLDSVELVEVVRGTKIWRVVVCSTVAVVRTVVGSDTVSVVVSVVVVPPPSALAARTPAIRQAASPTSCSDLLTRASYRFEPVRARRDELARWDTTPARVLD